MATYMEYKAGMAFTMETFEPCDMCDRQGAGTECTGHTQDHRKMTEQEYMQEQARIRAVKADPNSTQEEIDAAQAEWTAHVAVYPTITGVFTYTQEQVEEAHRHGY